MVKSLAPALLAELAKLKSTNASSSSSTSATAGKPRTKKPSKVNLKNMASPRPGVGNPWHGCHHTRNTCAKYLNFIFGSESCSNLQRQTRAARLWQKVNNNCNSSYKRHESKMCCCILVVKKCIHHHNYSIYIIYTVPVNRRRTLAFLLLLERLRRDRVCKISLCVCIYCIGLYIALNVPLPACPTLCYGCAA